MPAQSYFPVAIWLWRTLTGRRARRAYLALILLVISISAAARFYAFLQTRKIQAELSGLSQVRIDQTSEVELRQVLPSLSNMDILRILTTRPRSPTKPAGFQDGSWADGAPTTT